MIQFLMYCWNLRKLCIILDQRRAHSSFQSSSTVFADDPSEVESEILSAQGASYVSSGEFESEESDDSDCGMG